MFNPWLELDGVAERLGAWSELTGLDLLRLGTTAEAEEIKDTAVTQPLVVALSLIAAEELRRRVTVPAGTPVAGHSVGELAAAAVAGALSADDAVALAAVRGREMAAACALEPTGMSAVLGGDAADVVTYLEHLGLDPANRNGAGQIVAAGRLPALEQLAAEPPAGARVRPLPVAGAFHTRFMAPAQEALAKHAEQISTTDAELPLLSNADGAVVTDAAEIVRRLVSQVTSPVRWDSCMAGLAERGVEAVVELPPAGTLSGLVRREVKGVKTVALKTPADLDKVAELLGSDE
ncbi:[acyl-carrier-protein] S-malonyltransferase [Saccharopolyspora antimicrobica]|uniref:Malonyl CoA-acyl carrier protein transacylase n=2 Tax=Saccharopolyspora antimicrobica TaxID=455193 RepID=A0A1I4YF41_9PSEU|nr:[acyl-carrier-protein] S-malonyltransferase [Saccharopolyspora antimicrobica]SFN36681.1 [acyl-carrier-protein] S-malonyltransferase [Saccharopolyspora antimicrobica]